MNKYLLALLVLLATILCSCEEDEYLIEMRPSGQGLERKLTVGRYDQSKGKKVYSHFPPKTLAAIAELYPTQLKTSNPKIHGFMGTFVERTPNDVGGAGTYKRLQTAIGSAFIYVERFRGNDQPSEVLAEMSRSAERLTKLLTGWLKSEFGQHKEFPKIRRFIDEDLRKDIKNLSIYLWLGSNESRHFWQEGPGKNDRENVQKEIAARAFQYLFERNYLVAQDLAVFMKIEEEQPTELLEPLIRKFLAGKLKLVDQKLIDELTTLLTDSEQLEKSLSDYLASTDEYKKRLTDYKKELREFEKSQKHPQPDTITNMDESLSSPEPPEPHALLQEIIRGLLNVEFRPMSDKLRVELCIGHEPVATNGKWKEKDKRIIWSTNLTARYAQSSQLPELCYAVWCRPDEESQKNHFGKTILEGEQLLRYCLWYESLSKTEAAQWDTLLETLQPGEDLLNRLAAFRFTHGRATPPKPGDQESNYAKLAIELIKNALEPQSD